MSSTSKANRGLTHGGVKRSRKRNKNLRKKMGEERDKNIRHPRPAHVVMALFFFFCSPIHNYPEIFSYFGVSNFLKSKINSTAISNGQSPFLAREIWTARVWKSTAKKEERQKKKKKRGGGWGRECCCHWRRVGAWWTDHRQHTHTHNWLAVATATIEAGLLCVQEQHPVCVWLRLLLFYYRHLLFCVCVCLSCVVEPWCMYLSASYIILPLCVNEYDSI